MLFTFDRIWDMIMTIPVYCYILYNMKHENTAFEQMHYTYTFFVHVICTKKCSILYCIPYLL